jgi:hypothetical protein
MDYHRPGMPTLSLAAIARSIFEPQGTAQTQPKPEGDALATLRRTYPVVKSALATSYQQGLLGTEELKDIRTSLDDVMKAFADLANRRKKLGEAYDVRREETARLKVKATSSLAAFNEHSSQIAELASRLRDAGCLEEDEFLALLDLQELLRRTSREIVLWA